MQSQSQRRRFPTHRVEHVLDACLQCGTGLSGGWTQRTREERWEVC